MIMLSVLLLVLLAQPVLCQEEDGGYNFDEDIRQFAVATDTVYVATDERLYQLSHNLTLIQTLTLRGIVRAADRQEDAMFERVSESDKRNATLSVHVLLPFVNNDTLINCGVLDNECGYCELLNLRDISNMLHQELIVVGPLRRSKASVAILVNVTSDSVASSSETYILTAVQKNTTEEDSKCSIMSETVNLYNTNNNQKGLIFSVRGESGSAMLEFSEDVEFVDGFQVGASIYLVCNLPGRTNEVRLLWFKGDTGKVGTLASLQGGTLDVPDAGNSIKLLASSLVPGETPVHWVGVFTAEKVWAKTQLVLFDISTDMDKRTQKDPNFCFGCGKKTVDKLEKTLRPETVLFRHNHMTAVLAVRQKAWMVFFIGTQDGQLIKLAVDRHYQSLCPVVLYRANDDRLVFPKLHLDQVDHRYIYVPVRNQIKRVPVARCGRYATAQDCWSVQDPHCVWCSSKNSCTFEDDCQNSDWLSIPDEFQQRMISYQVAEKNTDQVTLMMQMHVTVGQNPVSNFACEFSANSAKLCAEEDASPNSLQCSCSFPKSALPTNGLTVQVGITLGGTYLSEQKKIYNCANMNGPPTSASCQRCLNTGCDWSGTSCTWANQGPTNVSVCQRMSAEQNFSAPTIWSISPDVVSFYGKNQVVLKGRNLGDVTGVRIQASMDCKPQESPVLSNTGEALMFNIPGSSHKGMVKVCVLLPDGTCHGNGNITYQSLPSCSDIKPHTSWFSGKRKITLTGSHLEFVEGVRHNHFPGEVQTPSVRFFQNLTYDSPAMQYGYVFESLVYFKVANQTVPCNKSITYYPNPRFSNFTTTKTGDAVRITIQKKADNLEMALGELSVWGVQSGKEYACLIKEKKNTDETEFFICDIMNSPEVKFQSLKIMYGNETVILTPESLASYSLLMLVLLLIPCIIILVVIVYRRKQKKLADQMNKRMEELELDIRNDIRQGFVDLQTEKADLLETAGTIPFLDYKHFAAKIFFPESQSLMASCIKDIGQDVVQVQLDEGCQGMSRLIHNQLFLTSMVHALEEQKNFSIKEKCTFASLLTVALHSDLPYLTEVMEALLRDLIQQSSCAQPKLLLRRTESIVEKLLTNWMSICLYGFLRETAGQHLFLMVSALTQQTAKGPVDWVTEKALYTLSEDWLLWQAPDFSSLKLKVLFAVGCDGEVSEPLEVNALSCDTVEQVKGKILASFKAKFGFPYCTPLGELRVEYQKNGLFVPLEEVDASSVVIREVTMLNTLKHYQVADGATIKVLSRKTHPPLSPQGSLKDDENFSGKYFHLIDPEDVEDQRKNPERKKLKLKEVHLTKLLSTKVAVHTYVENLFRSIWGTPHCKAPLAVKYFFDFLDAQADSMKITDPDMLHIWKTNSLPLRYWVNIIKNPQFVFDMEKTANLDGCLSVIGQAFMDSFSLTDTQLGKYAPTNKLLYAKDIPKFKQEVKVYYKQVREQSPVTASEFKNFLLEESKKHENEFNEAEALRKLYKFIERYLTEIKEKLDQNGTPSELKEQLLHVKNLFDGLKSCPWN